jgi:hypothetical protein
LNQGVKKCCSGKTSEASGQRQAASLPGTDFSGLEFRVYAARLKAELQTFHKAAHHRLAIPILSAKITASAV